VDWLHFSPDGGNGYVEWVIVLFAAVLRSRSCGVGLSAPGQRLLHVDCQHRPVGRIADVLGVLLRQQLERPLALFAVVEHACATA
jgi:hypothetical protein